MIKQILALGTFAAAGVAVAAIVDEDFRDKLTSAGRDVKDAFCKKVDAEEDEVCKGPENTDETDPEPFNKRHEDYMNSTKLSEEDPIVAPHENEYPGNDESFGSIDEEYQKSCEALTDDLKKSFGNSSESKEPENKDPEDNDELANTNFSLK